METFAGNMCTPFLRNHYCSEEPSSEELAWLSPSSDDSDSDEVIPDMNVESLRNSLSALTIELRTSLIVVCESSVNVLPSL